MAEMPLQLQYRYHCQLLL